MNNIRFVTVDCLGNNKTWNFSVEEIKSLWDNYSRILPNINDKVIACQIADVKIFVNTFGDLIKILGIEASVCNIPVLTEKQLLRKINVTHQLGFKNNVNCINLIGGKNGKL